MFDEKEELIERIEEAIGYLPDNTRLILKALSHPNVINAAKHYINVNDEAGRCLKYQYPWSCAKEAEAMYENIKFGWLGGVNGVGYDDNWCEPCRKKVMEE